MLLYALRFASSSPTIRVNTGALQTLTLAVTAGTNYFVAGDGASDDLCELLEAALNTNSDGVVFTVSASSRNVVTIQASAPSSILWADALTTVDPVLWGFRAINLGPATSFVGPDQSDGVWIPGTAARAVGFRSDTKKEPVTVGALMETENGDSRGYELGPSGGERTIRFHLLDRTKILDAFATTERALERAWTQALVRGREVRVYDDRTDRTTFERYRNRTRRRPWTEMELGGVKRYEVSLSLREVV